MFERKNVPDSLKNNASTIDTSTFGKPMGNYPSTGCNTQDFFTPQNMIIDITLCGGECGSLSDYDTPIEPDAFFFVHRLCRITSVFPADLCGAMLPRLCDQQWDRLRKCVF